jgi:hypothetical protein
MSGPIRLAILCLAGAGVLALALSDVGRRSEVSRVPRIELRAERLPPVTSRARTDGHSRSQEQKPHGRALDSSDARGEGKRPGGRTARAGVESVRGEDDDPSERGERTEDSTAGTQEGDDEGGTLADDDDVDDGGANAGSLGGDDDDGGDDDGGGDDGGDDDGGDDD